MRRGGARLALFGLAATAGCWPSHGVLPANDNHSFDYTAAVDFACTTDADCQGQYGLFALCDPAAFDCVDELDSGEPQFYGRCDAGTCRIRCVPPDLMSFGAGFKLDDGTYVACPDEGHNCLLGSTGEELCFESSRRFVCTYVQDVGQDLCRPSDATHADGAGGDSASGGDP